MSGVKGSKKGRGKGTTYDFRDRTDTTASNTTDVSNVAIAPASYAKDHPKNAETKEDLDDIDHTGADTSFNMAAETPETKTEAPKPTITSRKLSPDVVSNSRNLLTMARGRDMGYRTSPYWWRKVMMSPDHLKAKMTALDHKMKILKDHEFSQDELKELLKTVEQASLQGHKTRKEIFEFLRNNPQSEIKQFFPTNKTDKNKYTKLLDPNDSIIYKAMQQQFGRGLPSRASQVPVAIATVHDDVAFKQRLDISNEYEAAELINTIRQMITYQNTEIKLIDGGNGGCTITIPGTGFGASCILAKGASGVNFLEFSAKDNSEESLLHFADLVSMMRQGETNTIEFTDLGDPVAALSLLNDLLVDKRMHIVLTDDAKNKFWSDLKAVESQYDPKQIDKIKNLAAIYFANLQTFHPQNPRALSTWYSSKSPIAGSYANVVSWKARNATKAATWLYDKTIPLFKDLEVITVKQAEAAKASVEPANEKAANTTNKATKDHDDEDLQLGPVGGSTPTP